MKQRPLISSAWEGKELSAAVSALVQKARISVGHSSEQAAAQPFTGAEAGAVIDWQARATGCEAHPVQISFRDLFRELATTYPALLKIAGDRYLAVLKVRGRKMHLLAPDGCVQAVALSEVYQELCIPQEEAYREEYRRLLQAADISAARQDRALQLLLREQGGDKTFCDGWLLRVPIQAKTNRILQQAHVLKNGAWLVVAHIGEYCLWLLSWAILGRLSFEGHMDRGWLWLWATLLFTLIPFRVFATFIQGNLAIGTGAMLKRRLLLGALRLAPEEIRHGGIGSFLGQAFEAEAVESLTLSGGVAGILAVLELGAAACLLGRLSILLVVWCVLVVLLGWRFLQGYQRWTGTRMEMTQNLVENMVGHRTRLAQEKRSEWHRQEDGTLNGYWQRSREVDFGGTTLVAFLPRGWLLASLLCLAPTALSPANSQSDLAIKLGGVLLAFTAFKKLTASSVDIAATFVAGKRILPLFQAAQRPSPAGHLLPEKIPSTAQNVIEADRVTFRYRPGSTPALYPSSLSIRRGERVLLEGSSGGGKTTFASLLSGMRQPESGLLLLNGMDCHSVGAQQWREKVASAPQFHENHILTETLAANLLMGRNWPPTQSDIEQAESLCHRLGLGDLLERMPGGIMQMVGEGGWQLSHGERSRVYMARALLQKADLVILDESFAALDPQNLQTALRCTLEQAETLLVIAHP